MGEIFVEGWGGVEVVVEDVEVLFLGLWFGFFFVDCGVVGVFGFFLLG